MSETTSGAQTVAAERAVGPRVALLAVLAAVLPVVGTVAQTPLSNAPHNLLANLLYYDSHASAVYFGAVIRAVGTVALIAPLLFLMRSAAARGANVPRFAPGLTVVGVVLVAISTLAVSIASVGFSQRFATDTAITYTQAKNLLKGQAILAASAAGLIGSLSVGFGFVMASLNAMRVGLLTRFMGYVGILGGVLFVIPILSPVPIVQAFWLIAVAALIFGRWPSGMPPAWEDGEAHKWPSAAEARERAAAEREARSNGGA